MAGLKLFGILLTVLVLGLTEGRSISESKRSLKNDQIVREMMSLLQVRRKLSELKESARQVATSVPSTPAVVAEQESAASSHVQLCTDAVTFLSEQAPNTFEKRDFVMNYVVNYCIRPNANTDVIALLQALQAMDNDKQASVWWDWSAFSTSPPSVQSTTSDYWKQLFDELFNDEESDDSSTVPSISTTEAPVSNTTTEEDWFNALIAELFPEDEVPSTSPVPIIPQSTTEDFDLEEALNEFWDIFEGDNEKENEKEEGDEEDEGEGDQEDEEVEGEEDIFSNLLGQLQQEEENNKEAAPPTEKVVEVDEDSEESNDIPLDSERRMHMKKRLLDLLAKSLVQKRQEIMRK